MVPVRGSPVTNSGRSIGTCAYSGWACQAAWLNSRAASAPRSMARMALAPGGVRPASRVQDSSKTVSPSV